MGRVRVAEAGRSEAAVLTVKVELRRDCRLQEPVWNEKHGWGVGTLSDIVSKPCRGKGK